jgi:hypothetical protein
LPPIQNFVNANRERLCQAFPQAIFCASEGAGGGM